MTQALVKYLAGGAFVAGAGNDWRTQFLSATIVMAVPSSAGEILIPGAGTTYGIYAAYAFRAKNPYDISLCFPEAAVGSEIQVWLNGENLDEVDDPAVTLKVSVLPGDNYFEVVSGQAPLILVPSGPFFDPTLKTGEWLPISTAFGGSATGPLPPGSTSSTLGP